jgi:O-antigen/teichoic acid export membrane protein
LTSDVVSRGTTLVLYALVARYLGAFELGQLSLAVALFYMFQVLSAAGLRTLVVREVSRDKSLSHSYLVNGTAVIAVACLLSNGALLLYVRLMGYSDDTTSVILLVSLGLLPAALVALMDAVFQAWEQMHLIAWAKVPASIAKAGLAFLALSWGLGLYALAALILLTHLTIACIEWRFLRRYIPGPRGRLDAGVALSMVLRATTFLGIDVAVAVWAVLQVLLLSVLATETEVGLFNAGVQLLAPVTLVFHNVMQTVFPVMCRRFDSSCRDLKPLAEHALAFLLALALPVSAGLFVLADEALLFLYGGDEFLAGTVVIRILAWTVILKALTHALGQVLLAGRRERVTLRIVSVNAAVSLILGLLLIGPLGLTGAALAALVGSIVNAIQHYVPVSGLLGGISIGRLAWKPAAAAIAMTGVLIATSDWTPPLRLLAACAVYASALLALEVWDAGGAGGLRNRYSFLWPERQPARGDVSG